MPRRISFSTRNALLLRLTLTSVSCLSAFALTGCYQDKTQAYKATLDKNGDLVAPPDAKMPTNLASAARKETPPAEDKTGKDAKEAKAEKTLTEKEMGMPFYPGATPRRNKGDLPITTQSDTAAMLTLETPDPVAKVDAFYKAHLPMAQRLTDTFHGKATVGYMDYSDREMIRSVDISSADDKTVIALIISKAPPKPASPASAPPSPPLPEVVPPTR